MSRIDLTIPQGNYAGGPYTSVNKFGRTTNADSADPTDVHDGANATDDVAIWVAPTTARTHQIKSSQAADDGDPVGVGARTIRIYGLTSWDTAEVSEDITLNGITNVATVNQYVIIHRMKVLTSGATSINVGNITATADTDTTVTAQINAGNGQTLMAIYGVPSVKTAYITGYYTSALKSAAALRVAVALLVNENPNAQRTNFLTKHTLGIDTTGNSYFHHKFEPYKEIKGPAIIKIQANASADNTDVSAGFDLIMAD
jgi:hypothetical protein